MAAAAVTTADDNSDDHRRRRRLPPPPPPSSLSSNSKLGLTPAPTPVQHFLYMVRCYRYAVSCLIFGALTLLLGVAFCFAAILFRRHSGAQSLHLMESVPLYLPGVILCFNGALSVAFVKQNFRRPYLIKTIHGLYMLAAGLSAIVASTTGWVHLPRFRTHRECAYNLPLRACTCTNLMMMRMMAATAPSTPVDISDDETAATTNAATGYHFTIESVSNCDLVHGLIYDTLRVVYALSLLTLVVSIGSIITMYELFRHQKHKQQHSSSGGGASGFRFLISPSPLLRDVVVSDDHVEDHQHSRRRSTIKCLSAADFSSQDLLLDLQHYHQHHPHHHHHHHHRHQQQTPPIQEQMDENQILATKIWSLSSPSKRKNRTTNKEISAENHPRWWQLWRLFTSSGNAATNTSGSVRIQHHHNHPLDEDRQSDIPPPPRIVIPTTGYSIAPATGAAATSTTTASLKTSPSTSAAAVDDTSKFSHPHSSSSSSSSESSLSYYYQYGKQKPNNDDDEENQFEPEAGFMFDEVRTDFTSRSDDNRFPDFTKTLFPCIDEDDDDVGGVENFYIRDPAAEQMASDTHSHQSNNNLLMPYFDTFAKITNDVDNDSYNHQSQLRQSTWTFEEAFKNYYDSQNRISGTLEYWNTLPSLNRRPTANHTNKQSLKPTSATTIIIEPPIDYQTAANKSYVDTAQQLWAATTSRQVEPPEPEQPPPVIIKETEPLPPITKLPVDNLDDDDNDDDDDDDEEDDEEDEEDEVDDGAGGDTSTSQDLADFELELDDEPVQFLSDEDFRMLVAKQAEMIGTSTPPPPPPPPLLPSRQYRQPPQPDQLDLMAMMIQQQRRMVLAGKPDNQEFNLQDLQDSSTATTTSTTPTTSSSLTTNRAPAKELATTTATSDNSTEDDEEHSVETAEFIKPPTPFTNYFV